MIGKSWNRADKTLWAAAVLFAFALCLHLEYPNQLLASGFLACTEAALVGGIADWFAVTALFRKPLGFSWHTAILPRRRQLFIESSVTMVQREFFSTRKIFQWLRKMDFTRFLLEGMEQENLQKWVQNQFLPLLQKQLLTVQPAEIQQRAEKCRSFFLSLPGDTVWAAGKHWFCTGNHQEEAFLRIVAWAQAKIEQPAFCRNLEQALAAYQKEHFGGGLAGLLAGFMQSMDVVNYSEAAQLVQQRCRELLVAAAEKGSPEQQRFLAMFAEKIADWEKNANFCQTVEACWTDFLEKLPWEKLLQQVVSFSGELLVQERLSREIATEIQSVIGLFRTDEDLRHLLDRFLYDAAARSALQAQSLVGVIVRSVLEPMTDEQMNRLVYEKVEPDLLWIRMNGSLVGAGIGLVLFIAGKIAVI